MDKLDTIQSALSSVLGSHDREASTFLIGSTTIQKGSLFIPGLSDTDLLVVPRCESLGEYEEWLERIAELHNELNQSDGQLYDVFILSDYIASVHFASLSSICSPLPGTDALINKKGATRIAKTTIDPSVRIGIYRAMLRYMISKAEYLLPVADTGQGRKTVKYLRKIVKVAICAYANASELDILEDKLLITNDLNGLGQLAAQTLPHAISFDDIFQSVLDGERVNDWPAWMMAQEALVYSLFALEESLPKQDAKDIRLYSGIAKTTLMLFMEVKAILRETEEDQRAKIGKFADDTASVLVQLALSGADSLADFTTSSTPERVKASYEILINHLEADRSNMRCFAASVILLEYALMSSIVEKDK